MTTKIYRLTVNSNFEPVKTSVRVLVVACVGTDGLALARQGFSRLHVLLLASGVH